MTSEAYEAGRITNACQDGSREFISLLACISATGVALPPSLIYKGDSDTLQSSWIEDWSPTSLAHFTVSSNGWSCNALGLHWLEAIFHRYTNNRASRGRRLLIVDGHSSHVNLQFISLCDRLRIILLILPPHSTHRLQPLDVSLFAPLARYYTNGLNKLLSDSLGIVSMSKRAFWSVFWPAWNEAFTEKNILSGFKKTGIWPYNPSPMLSTISKPLPATTHTPPGLKTPLTSRAIRRIQRQYSYAPTSVIVKKLFRSAELLSSQHSIDTHILKGLTQSLKNEKKKRQKGKRLNLLGEDDSGPQFFSPRRIQAAREWQAQKDANEVIRQQELANKKVKAAIKKAQQAADKIQRAIIIANRRQATVDAKIQKAIDRQAQEELKKAAMTTPKVQKTPKKKSLLLHQAPKAIRKQTDVIGDVDRVVMRKEAVAATSRGRRVFRPQRFED